MRIHKNILWLLALFGLALAACGGSIESTPLVVISETADTRTIEHTFGTTVIPTNPQRVIALGEEGMLADLLDAGITPLASIVNVPEELPVYISPEEVANVELYSSSTNTSIERLAALEPDLIIGHAFFIDQIGYETLSQMAPTIAVGGSNEVENYIETLLALGPDEKAASDMAAFEETLAAARSELESGNQRFRSSHLPRQQHCCLNGPPAHGALASARAGCYFVPRRKRRRPQRADWPRLHQPGAAGPALGHASVPSEE